MIRISCLIWIILFTGLGSITFSEELYRFDRDPEIKKIIFHLNPGWKSRVQNQFWYLEKKSPIHILSENRINAPLEKESERNKRVRKYGVRTRARFVFWVEEKWKPERIQGVHHENQLIRQEIDRQITEYYSNNNKRFSRPNTKMMPENEDPEYRDLNQRIENLKKGLVAVPDYQSSRYAYFLIDVTGFEDDSHLVVPEDLYKEMHAVESLLDKNLVKVSTRFSRVPLIKTIP